MKNIYIGALIAFLLTTGCGKKEGTHTHADGSTHANHQKTATDSTQIAKSYPLIKMEEAGSGPSVKRPVEADNPPPKSQLTEREDSVQIIVPARKGIEFKMNMLKFGTVKYEWISGGTVYFDFHGEVKQEKETKDVFFESYTIAYSSNVVGTFLAPFEGKHGWYFKNLTDKDVKVSLRLKGQYFL